MTRFQRIISFALIPAILLLLVYLPKFTDAMLGRDYYREWMEPKSEDFEGVITVWHVVGFKPYLGSLGSWLSERARSVEKKHFGVYFEVDSITVDEAAARISNGKFPDALSFPSGWCSGGELAVLEGEYDVDVSSGMDMAVLRAVPYCASCSVILYYPSKITASELSEDPGMAQDNSLEDFKKGKVSCCLADARDSGDLQRALIAGKAEYFEVLPFLNETDLVQYLGTSADCEPAKLPYINELFNAALSEKAQSQLCSIGLMPLNERVERKYEQAFLGEAYGLIDQSMYKFPNTFDEWHRNCG
ncbi:MAG: hypothetical protein J1E60_03800 [Christensenellaceae bacterium]|nr:hypothetical protein [Christensenellaceae bacterium]